MLEDDNFYYKISGLIVKEKTGIITSEEKELLKNWREESNYHEEVYQRIELRLKGKEVKSYWDEKVILKDWKNTRQKLIGKPSKYRLFYRTIKYAALIILLIGIGWGTRSLIKSGDIAVVSEMASNKVHPGTPKAILTLASGEQILLDSQNADSIQREGVLIKKQLGRLIYDTTQNLVDRERWNTITVPRGGEYQVTLSDGTQIWMNAETELSYPVVFGGKERKVKMSGEAYFEVSKDREHPFVITTTDEVDIRVLGTSFNVNAYKNEEEIVTTLLEGCVQINRENKTEKLKASEQAIWSRKTDKLQVRKVDASIYILWRDGDFSFRDDDLETIMRNLARWYVMDYEFEEPTLKGERFYGAINRYHDIRELLSQFEKTGKVRFEYQGTKIIIKK